MVSFREKVLKVVARIPKGMVMSYKEVARAAGRPRACRVVGSILSKNYNPEIPCHRVVMSSGKINGYNRGIAKKKSLLKREGANKEKKSSLKNLK